MIKHHPLCEACGRRTATVLVGFRPAGAVQVERWQFTCADETAADETESFSLDDFLSSPMTTVDRLAHLHQSGRMDWTPFMDMIVRLRTAMLRAERRIA